MMFRVDQICGNHFSKKKKHNNNKSLFRHKPSFWPSIQPWDLKNRNPRENCFILHLFTMILELLEPVSWQNKVKNQCFVLIDHFDHEFDYRTYLELKRSSGALDCLNITSVSLLGCSFVPKQGPWSLILGPWSLLLDPWSSTLDPWSLIVCQIIFRETI